jgi:uncharacterized protein (DUF433 family)
MAILEPLITISPARPSGAPAFAGTRVPVQELIDYLAGGDTLQTFLDDFPSVTREHVVGDHAAARRGRSCRYSTAARPKLCPGSAGPTSRTRPGAGARRADPSTRARPSSTGVDGSAMPTRASQ